MKPGRGNLHSPSPDPVVNSSYHVEVRYTFTLGQNLVSTREYTNLNIINMWVKYACIKIENMKMSIIFNHSMKPI